MIYIIGGAPRVGKSIISKKLSEIEDIPLISTDDLEDKKVTSTKEVMPIFYRDPKKNVITPDERVKLIIQEAKELYSDIEEVIHENRDKDIIIEGVHLLPEFMLQQKQNLNGDNVKMIVIGSRSSEKLLQGMKQNTDPGNWQRSFPEESLKHIADFSQALSLYLFEESQKAHIEYMERTDNFQEDIKKVIEKFGE